MELLQVSAKILDVIGSPLGRVMPLSLCPRSVVFVFTVRAATDKAAVAEAKGEFRYRIARTWCRHIGVLLKHHRLLVRIQVYKHYLHWLLKAVDVTYIGLLGFGL